MRRLSLQADGDSSGLVKCNWTGCDFACEGEAIYDHLVEAHAKPQTKKTTKAKKLYCRYSDCSVSVGKCDHLTSHLRTHVDHRPHACGICERRFKRKQDLRKHSKTHGRSELKTKRTAMMMEDSSGSSSSESATPPTPNANDEKHKEVFQQATVPFSSCTLVGKSNLRADLICEPLALNLGSPAPPLPYMMYPHLIHDRDAANNAATAILEIDPKDVFSGRVEMLAGNKALRLDMKNFTGRDIMAQEPQPVFFPEMTLFPPTPPECPMPEKRPNLDCVRLDMEQSSLDVMWHPAHPARKWECGNEASDQLGTFFYGLDYAI